MGISKFKKEHNKAIEHMKSPEFKGFTTSFEEGKEEVTEIRARKLSPLGWELVWRYRIRELEDREQKWKKQNKRIKELKHQLAEKDKEIEELRNAFIQEKEFLNKQYDRCDKARKKSVEELKEIRHQVIEEIIKKAQKENRHLIDHAKLESINDTLYTISGYVLYQIEKGESK